MLNYSDVYSTLCLLSKSERAAAHMQVTVLTLARLKTLPTIKNLYFIQYPSVDELSIFNFLIFLFIYFSPGNTSTIGSLNKIPAPFP